MSARLIPRPPFFHSLVHSSSTAAVRPGFLTSLSSSYVNPRQHVIGTDCITQVIPASAVAGVSDERVLALFTSGFFGGFVFAPEWLLLTAVGGRILPVGYTGFLREGHTAQTLWRRAHVSDSRLHPVGTCFFGTFMILDKHIAIESEVAEPSRRASWIDYGFGSDESSFAGCHRFQITRIEDTGGEGPSKTDSTTESQVQVELQSFQCNPQKNVPFGSEILKQFHSQYARLLFANGIQSVLLQGT
ncbi:hypothetical protein ASPACDRAFT_42661 [Aspergillus aculeatus ATCC 16872]|uniref:Uncharacterized protein n=1 Tax=Aspergillus aculeatus (strain ATCC 16872 / CBS 172.66 / WB 5094) TaxID=690307 RepID=A0A1L9WV41_ASPA1|nr:uncharacterized protein ASPACDRAFT_42661 [Aspergillus aculeatus ATCC 16872]OJK00081.1 hypothetical protein ASPACDRAFT_42661 [Aspergillus aculeatus ATCC 16872]